MGCCSFLTESCACCANTCACCASSCTCLTACTVCCGDCCCADKRDRRRSHSADRRRRRPLAASTPPSRVLLEDLLKLITICAGDSTPKTVATSLDTGEVALSRHAAFVKQARCGQASVTAIEVHDRDLLVHHHVAEVQTNPEMILVFHADGVPSAVVDIDDYELEPFAEAQGIDVDAAVHSGIAGLWRSVYEDVTETVQLFIKEHPHGTVVATGWGAGGAMAALHALFTQTQLVLGARLTFVSFGAMRIGNGRFQQEFDRLIHEGHAYRIVNNRDEVPEYMRGGLFAGSRLQHCGQVVHMRRERVCDRYWAGCKRACKSLRYDDHDVHAYQMRVASWDGRFLRLQ